MEWLYFLLGFKIARAPIPFGILARYLIVELEWKIHAF